MAKEHAMSKSMPPVPPDQKSPFGGSEHAHDHPEIQEDTEGDTRRRDLSKQGRQGNIRQNTTHQGFQQDR